MDMWEVVPWNNEEGCSLKQDGASVAGVYRNYDATEIARKLNAFDGMLVALKYHHERQIEHGQREGFGYINSKPHMDTVAAIAKAEGK